MEPTPPTDVPADVEIDLNLVQGLVREQHPDLTGPIRRLSAGWDNEIFRLGEDLLVRLPRRSMGADNLERERTWLPQLPRLPLAVPRPLRTGEPSSHYPYPWTIVPFLPGRAVGTTSIDSRPLLGFLDALHRPAPPGIPVRAARSMTLRERAQDVRHRLRFADDPNGLWSLYEEACDQPGHTGPPLWTHGDLHPFNLLTDGTRLTAVIDWGDLFGGDPAPDLAALWMLEGANAYRGPAARWNRGIGWAIYFVAMLLDGVDRGASPAFATVARRCARRLVHARLRRA